MSERQIQDIYPLSPMQEGMLFHTLYAPQSGAYFIQTLCQVSGALDAEAFRRAWQDAVDRHGILRTAFNWEKRQRPFQIVYRGVALPLEQLDWREVPDAEQERRFAQLLTRDRARGFDLASPPLMRVTLVQRGPERHAFLLSNHHVLMDGWCQHALLKEVFDAYRAYSAGREPEIPSTPPYSAYIGWLQKQDRAQAQAFWREALGDFARPTPLGVDRPARRRSESSAHVVHETLLSLELTGALQALARGCQVTMNTVLLGAWALVLSRYSGEDDVVFGATVSGRPADLPGAESIVGLFINTLPLRARVRSDVRVSEWLQGLQAQQVRQRQYEYSSLAEVQAQSGVPRGTPLFESLLVFENYPRVAAETGAGRTGAPAGPVVHDMRMVEWTNYPLTLVASPGERLAVGLSYDTARFDAKTIERMAGHLATVLAGMVRGPEGTLGSLSLLTAAERDAMVTAPAAAAGVVVRVPCLHDLFEAQVRRTPEAVAVRFEDQSLSYGELDRRASRLARALRRRGAGPEVPVAICAERSIDLVVGVLGILKSGGAYLPIDLACPGERIAFMLEDSGAPILVTQRALLERLPKTGAAVVLLDEAFGEADLAHESPDEPAGPVHSCGADNLAYIIYTSGSTGRPKGVWVSHANVVRLFRSTDRWFGFSEKDVWTLFHSSAFDFSVWELWGALLYGGRLVVVPYYVSRAPEAFYRLLGREGVTVLNQTPSAFRQLIAAEETVGMQPLALRLVIFGGEALELQSLTPWFDRHGDDAPRLVNMYGITETTVHVTYRPVLRADVEAGRGSVIGCPIPDLQMYVLDASGQPVPCGVPGELYVGGAGLARGYLSRPELTAARFLPHPFSRRPGERVYRTGDLARQLDDGDVEYLGRVDQQVKVRGFRVETGEIEAELVRHPEVREAVVVLREDAPGERRLVGYVVPCNENAPTVSDLRQTLKQRLPEYMVPVAFVVLQAIPLTSNGKVDRKALPEPDSARPDLAQAWAAPHTLEEEALASIWAQALGLETVGIDDNFFELGGDSIRSLQVLARARDRGLPLTLPQLFETPTIRELCRAMAAGTASPKPAAEIRPFALLSMKDRDALPPGLEDAYPLTQLQTGMLFHSEYEPESTSYHNVSTMTLRGSLDASTLQEAVCRVMARHPVLRTSVDLARFSEPLQLVHADVEAPLVIEDLRGVPAARQGEARAGWFENEQRRRIDWTRPPLFRIHVYLLSEETFELGLAEHHAILDGWSVASLLTELAVVYATLLRDPSAPAAPALTSHFRECVALERQALESSEARTFWEAKLRDVVITPLPRSSRAGRGPLAHGVAQHVLVMRHDLVAGVQRLARTLSVPVKSVLLAAHVRVLAVLTGQADVVTGLVGNVRPEGPDGEKVLGLFLNTLPLRLGLEGGTWADLIRSAFDAERELLPFRRFPLAEMQRLASGRRPFETVFNFVHFHVYRGLSASQGWDVLASSAVQDTEFPLAANFSLEPGEGALSLALHYDRARFGGEEIEAMAGLYERALDAMVREPGARQAHTSLLTEAQRRQVTVDWAQGAASSGDDELVLRTFERYARSKADRVAAVFEGQELTYGELDRRANELAARLRSSGVGPEVCVGLAVDRSLDLLIGLLGVLKSGGAYLPLDPAYPRERLAFMLSDARVPVIVTERRLRDALPEHAARIVCVDDAPRDESGRSCCGVVAPVSPDQLAYVIYTSGSTGRPKGTLLTHRGLANMARAQADTFAVRAESRVLQFSSLSFDASIFEIVMALTAGAALYMARRDTLLPGPELAGWIERHGITHVTLPPSVLGAIPVSLLPALETVIVAGEACPPELVANWAPGRRFFNAYGPTETTVWATVARCEAGTRRPPIGRPVRNFQAFVLDRNLQPAPPGAPGELCLGGVGLARGYLGRADLTAERFVPHPCASRPGERLYRTGDLVRHGAYGALEYLGRIDTQVKLRGFRIELGEVEAALAAHAGVREAVALLQDGPGGEQRLVAYVVAAPGVLPSAPDLRAHLAARLPDYMVPAAFVPLERLPLSPNGKVDRRALPRADAAALASTRAYVAPRSATEERLAALWAESLGVERVGLEDDFFELGGHSLAAIKLVTRVKDAFEVEVGVRCLYESPRLAEFSLKIAERQAQGADQALLAQALSELSQLSDREAARLLAESER